MQEEEHDAREQHDVGGDAVLLGGDAILTVQGLHDLAHVFPALIQFAHFVEIEQRLELMYACERQRINLFLKCT